MKNFIKDIMVSIIIGFITFYLIYVINGSVLYNDLYAQGLPFLEYFKNQFSILDGGLGYNWNMGLGDSSYSFIIYYLLSPFNLLLLPFKSVNMVTILPIFMTIKISFIVYFASLYFKRVVSHEYRWIGALIYLGSYNILMYGSIHVMWLDTFAFLPLVLLAIEKVINKEGYTAYVIALFLLIVTNYYLAALLIIHIAIYGITRYVVINGRVGMLRFILKTIGYSVIAGLLASFVFVPAIGYMLSSSKDISSINLLTNSLSRLFNVISSNYIGSQYSYSGTYITLIGLISIIPIILFTNVKGRYLYLVPIVLILLAVFSDHINMMFNLGYEACGGNYRYNILLNIYVGIIACSGLKSISSGNRRVCFTVCLVSILSICIFKNQPSVNTQVLYLNIGFVICYTVLIILLSRKNLSRTNISRWIIILLGVLLVSEIFLYSYFINKNREFIDESYANNIREIVSYVGEKYNDGRVEINDKGGVYNTYLSKNVAGVEGFHSLMKSSYRGIGDVFTDTAYMKVINRLSGRNIITRFTGEKYYVSPYNYCPYIGSELIEKHGDYYIYMVPNKEIKFFSRVTNNLPESMISKDVVLYDRLYIQDDLPKDHNNNQNKISRTTIVANQVLIKENGEYYLSLNTAPPNDYTPFNISINVNGMDISSKGHLSKLINYNKSSEIYIGYLKSGDRVKFDFDIGNDPQLLCIDSNYIKSSMKNMDAVKVQTTNRGKNSYNAKIKIDNSGYISLPVVYDSNWKIYNNGKEISPKVINGGFIGLKLDKGEHNITMKYCNRYVYIGFSMSIITFICILGWKFRNIRK